MPTAPAPNRAHGRDPVDGDELFAAAVELVTSSSASFKRTARRFSLCGQDAEDAYQRSLEILLTKAPTARPEELRPWLHTVVKHEALALRRQRERSVSAEEDAAGVAALAAAGHGPDEAATGRERAHRTAEALSALKPNEVQCLVLKALGYSYEEIAARTGFSWTKVNRSLTQGRRRFLERFGEIASGGACDAYLPLLSAACDGQSTAADERRVRAHLAACPGCRAALREFRSTPARLAELVPPAAVLPLLERTGTWTRISDWFAVNAGERAAAIGMKVQQGAEVVSAQKAAAVVATTAAVAGGGAAVQQGEPPARGGAERGEQAQRTTPAATPPPAEPPVTQPAPSPAPAKSAEPAAHEAERQQPTPPAEFGFEDGSGDAAAAATAAAASPPPASEFSPAAGRAAPASGGGGGEFGP